ncbi:MAG TPA: RNA polymerase sigma factor [Solirubrobacteraceae bacterium]|nr:RNA polymerase sigma factor [Solirubrobacteraceae bacterium]
MEASALQHSAGLAGIHGRSPLLRLQSDERLIALVRRGSPHAFEALVARYQSRLLAFCRHMLASKEDAEDVLQEVFAAAFNAILADEREINVRPWLYRIARNRSLNHLRRAQAVGVDSMDVHFSEHGLTTADKVHRREEFRLLMADVQDLPETQKTALLLREIDALSYDQIAEAMETTVPSVKSLLVRARVSLAEAAEARLLTCEEVREELGRIAEGLAGTTAPLRRHLRTCEQCTAFRKHLRATNRALAALFPVAPLLLLKKTILAHVGTSAAASGGTAAASGGAAAAAGAAAQAGIGTLATKTVAGLAAAAIVTAGAVEVQHVARKPKPRAEVAVAAAAPAAPAPPAVAAPAPLVEPAREARPRRAAPKPRVETKPKAKLTAAVKPEATPVAATGEEPGLTEEHESATTTLPGGPTGTTAPSEDATAPEQPSGPYAPPTTTVQPSPTPQPAEPTPTPTPTPEPTPAPEPTPSPTPEPTPAPES